MALGFRERYLEAVAHCLLNDVQLTQNKTATSRWTRCKTYVISMRKNSQAEKGAKDSKVKK